MSEFLRHAFIVTGDKMFPVEKVELDMTPIEPGRIDKELQQANEVLSKVLRGGWAASWNFNVTASTTQSALDVIDSTATVVDDNVRALPAPGEVMGIATVNAECRHEDFVANVAVNRLEDTGGFAADITIRCAECQKPFQFLGLPGGLSPDKPTVSADCPEARMPIAPLGEVR